MKLFEKKHFANQFRLTFVRLSVEEFVLKREPIGSYQNILKHEWLMSIGRCFFFFLFKYYEDVGRVEEQFHFLFEVKEDVGL